MNQTIELLRSHRSIRKFTQQKIPSDLFRALVEAGQCAATSSHIQAYSVIHVTDMTKRKTIAELAGGQHYVASASDFLVICADISRSAAAARRAGAEIIIGTTEQLLVASIDAAMMAQNLVVAAESAGLGICYIGGIRNAPAEVSELLQLPEDVYPVFGLCLGYPDQTPEVKPRLPLAAILKENVYSVDRDDTLVDEFDERMAHYYQERSGSNKTSNWSNQLGTLFTAKLRLHMKEFLRKRGFGLK